MKRMVSLLLVLVMLLGMTVPALADEKADFRDVPPEHWAYEAVMKMVDAGVIRGTGLWTFSPEMKVSAAQFVTLVGRMGEPWLEQVADDEDTWYAPYAAALKDAGWLDGTNVDINDLEAEITRYDMAAILWPAAKAMGGIEDTMAQPEQIADYATIPPQYVDAVRVMYGVGLITGDQNGSFNGADTMTRAEAATVLMRLKALTDARLRAEREAKREAEAGYGDFALDLLRASRKEGKNTLLSPLSVMLALGMAAAGADGETKQEFADLFGVEPEELSPYCLALMERYRDLGGSSETNLVNSIWCDPDLILNDSYVQTCQDYFDAELFHADLQSDETVDAINGWVNEATREKIPSLLKRPLPEGAVLALINAVYFKNRFEWPFATPSTPWTMDFHNADGTVSQPYGMYNKLKTTYLSHEGGQGVILPYDDGKLGFLLMLPDEDLGLTEYLESWDGRTIADLLDAQTSAKVSLTVPKFKAEWTGELNDTLKALGLRRAFDFFTADFTPMGHSKFGNLFISSVIHKTAFEVNEKGTEAAAVTAVMMGSGSGTPPETVIYLTFDRPFVYGIVDLDTGTPLFLGTLEQVESADLTENTAAATNAWEEQKDRLNELKDLLLEQEGLFDVYCWDKDDVYVEPWGDIEDIQVELDMKRVAELMDEIGLYMVCVRPEGFKEPVELVVPWYAGSKICYSRSVVPKNSWADEGEWISLGDGWYIQYDWEI